MSKYDYYCEFYHKTNRLPTEQELAKYMLFGVIDGKEDKQRIEDLNNLKEMQYRIAKFKNRSK